MNYVDWKIHRKLDEARRIYFYPARGSGKTKVLLDLINSGKKVRTVTKADIQKRKTDAEEINKIVRRLNAHRFDPLQQHWYEASWEELKMRFDIGKSNDDPKYTLICTSNPYGYSWFI